MGALNLFKEKIYVCARCGKELTKSQLIEQKTRINDENLALYLVKFIIEEG